MHKEIKELDVQRMARGAWDDAFRSKFHPKVKTPWLIALILFFVGVAIIVVVAVSGATDPGATSPPAIAWLAILLVVGAAGCFLKGQFDVQAEREKYIQYSVKEWDGGNGILPDIDTVHGYVLKGHEVQL